MSIVLESTDNPILDTLARLCGPDHHAPAPDTSPASFLHHCWDIVAIHLYLAHKAIHAYTPTDPALADLRTLYLGVFARCAGFVNFVPPDVLDRLLDEEETRELDRDHTQGHHDATPDARCCACAASFPEEEHEPHWACTLAPPRQAVSAA